MRPPPEVRIAPTDTLAYLGADTAFTATDSGDDFVTLQWRHNGRDIPGATNEILRLERLTADAGGEYDLTVITVGGSTTSNAAGLRIAPEVADPVIEIVHGDEADVWLGSRGRGMHRGAPQVSRGWEPASAAPSGSVATNPSPPPGLELGGKPSGAVGTPRPTSP